MRETKALFEDVVAECFPKYTNELKSDIQVVVQTFIRINTENPEGEISSTDSKKRISCYL